MRLNLLFPLILFSLSTCTSRQSSGPPHSPEEALTSISLPDGFQIELFAAEPLISDPVAMEIDEYGRVWVVEMHGYPLDTAGSGKVKILSDTNGDGRMDRSAIFAEGLTLPSGIMRWGNGILVTDPPDVLYFEDTDGDDKADKREVMLTGFARSNPQHNLNTPRFAFDNWIYLGHEGTISTKSYVAEFGDEGSEVFFPGNPQGPRLPQNAASRSVRFQPRGHKLEMLSGETQFGYTFSPRGQLINTNNYAYLLHEVLAERYLDRNPDLLIGNPVQFIPAGGPGTTVYPITQNPNHQLLTDAGVITSGCAVTWYQGGLFPEPYDKVVFTAEPVHNLVHTDIVEGNGASFTATPQFDKKEFLASTDSWFRPVNFHVGPDGALYLLDYYRQIIEHPEWMSDEINASGQLYNGTDMGRMYRISPKGTEPATFTQGLALGDASPRELSGFLASPNKWWRINAQRLLVYGHMLEAVPHLQELALEGETPHARIAALWTLEGLGALQPEDLSKPLTDPDPGVRENAVKLSEGLLGKNSGLLSMVRELAGDGDAKVRFQVLCTLGDFDDVQSRMACRSILLQDLADPWVRLAALTAVKGFDVDELLVLLNDPDIEGAVPFLEMQAELIGRKGDKTEITSMLRRASRMGEEKADLAAAVLRGLSRGIEEKGSTLSSTSQDPLIAMFSTGTPPAIRSAALGLLDQTGYFDAPRPAQASLAESYAFDKDRDPALRVDAIKVLGWTEGKKIGPGLWELVNPEEDAEVQMGALEALGPIADTALCRQMLERWPSLSPELRSKAIDLFMANNQRRMMLLDAKDRHIVLQEQIGWRRTVSLLNDDDEEVRAKARSVLEGNESGKKMNPEDIAGILRLRGQAEKGQEVFQRNCAICHQLNGEGGLALGPDLASVRNRTPDAILKDILEPNAAIADGYELWSLTRKDGSRLSGLMVTESSSAITLRDLTGKDTRVARNDIASLEAQPQSTMPDGLKARISDQEMADLLALLSGRLQ